VNRFAGPLGAALTCLLVAILAIGCSRSALDDDLVSGGPDAGDAGGDGTAPEGSPPPTCGDGKCDDGETCSTCALDCGACSTCGDGKCESGETCSNCPMDCGDCAKCGDGLCTAPEENCQNCAPDCGACPGCGDGTCTPPNETCFSCPKDCGNCTGCGDGMCESNETCASCPQDCGSCDVCGNGKCETPYETCTNCPADCGACTVKTCFESLTCVIGCFGGLGGGGGGGDGGFMLPANLLTCTANCIAPACPSADVFLNDAVNCFVGAIGTCGGININCLMSTCSSAITACLDSHC
jgi:hypothetical protein